MTTLYRNGNVEASVPAGEKVAIYSLAPVQLYQKVGFPNYPEQWDYVATTTAGSAYTSAAFTNATTIRMESGAADGQYEIGAAPVIGEPTADLSMADATAVIQGLADAQGGYVKVIGGTSSTAGNAGGEAGIKGGEPGATGVGGAATVLGGAGGATSGKGGAATVTGGAGTNGNAAGGSVLLTPGAKHGSGLDGGVFNRGTYQFFKQAAAVAKGDGAQSITAIQMIGGLVVQTITGASTLTTPTGALILAACPTDIAAGDAFLLRVITLGAGADDITTLTAGDGYVTFVGDVTVGPGAAGTTSGATFLFRYTGANAFVGYRVG